jgi:plasmid maintenance system antidote protein VapI
MIKITPDSQLFSPTNVFYNTFLFDRGIKKTQAAEIFGVSKVMFTYLLKNKINLNMEYIINASNNTSLSPDILINLRFIYDAVKRLLNHYPELSKYQKDIHAMIFED